MDIHVIVFKKDYVPWMKGALTEMEKYRLKRSSKGIIKMIF